MTNNPLKWSFIPTQDIKVNLRFKKLCHTTGKKFQSSQTIIEVASSLASKLEVSNTQCRQDNHNHSQDHFFSGSHSSENSVQVLIKGQNTVG